MKPKTGLDSFWPYDSIDDIFDEKKQPEFGLVPSAWHFTLPAWRFLHAENRDMVPIDFELPEFSDDTWDAVELPSVWQQEGYGLPSNLSYDAGSRTEESKLSKRLQTKLSTLAGSDVDDDVGVYRTWIVLPPSFSERAVYFSGSGIRGRFEFYVNGRLAMSSEAWYTARRILLSPYLNGANNLLTLLVYRLDSDRHGRIRKENGTFGYSGVFRMPEIVAEPFVELTGIRISTSWIENSQMELIKTVAISNQVSPEVLTDASAASEEPKIADVDTDTDQRRNGRIRMQVQLHNHTDHSIPVRVECGLLEARSEYDLYHLPEVHISLLQELQDSIKAGSDLTLDSEIYADCVLPWTDQTPHLYDIVLTVKDKHDRVICVKKRRFGFRTTEVIGRVFHINDIALPLRVVRYFDFDPVGGLAVSTERMRQDVCLMKQANLNAVLVAHFPSDPIFYRLCDRYGLYVISQADASHMNMMFESLMTHPSIVLWSFAPLHFDEGKLWELKQKLLLLDGSRPFYCEKDRSLALSDIPPFPCEAGAFFGEWTDICVDRAVLASKLEPGRTIFDTQKGRAVHVDSAPDIRWLHQGDLEEYHEKNDSPIAQGLLSADRMPHPSYYETKKQCETLQFIASAENPADLSLCNLHPIGETHELTLYWQILLGGHRLRGGHGAVKSMAPLGEKLIRFPFDVADYLQSGWMCSDPHFQRIYDTSESHELVFDVRVCLAKDTDYALAGHEVAFYQQVLLDDVAGASDAAVSAGTSGAADAADFSDDSVSADSADSSDVQDGGADYFLNLPAAVTNQPCATGSAVQSAKLTVSSRPVCLQIAHSDIKIAISRKTGGLCSILIGDRELLAGSMQPSFFRAATNSDRSDQSFVLAATVFSKETDWRTIQHDLRSQKIHYEMIGEDFSMLIHYKSFAFRGDVLVQYLMSPDGKLTVTLAFTPRYDLIRSGFRVHMPRGMNQLCWYGRGLREAYPDRKESTGLGHFESTPEELYHEYARPQENGGHCDTQYLLISDGSGKGMKISALGPERFSFTASLFSPEEIDDYQHQEELLTGDTYELFLDFYQRGIERTGREERQIVRNQNYRGTFVFEPWEAVQSEPSDHVSL